ncbi:hypothetical protein DXG01_015127 [Tephrocybe rancida]|nr:hypothetical protein DXG01_015127 [Tephrocybe rancida]
MEHRRSIGLGRGGADDHRALRHAAPAPTHKTGCELPNVAGIAYILPSPTRPQHYLSSLYASPPWSSSSSSKIGGLPTYPRQNTDVIPGYTESRGARPGLGSHSSGTSEPLVTAFPDVDLTVTVATDGGLLQSEAFTSSHTVASSARSPCHGAEHARGAYQYLNIWRALVNGAPTIYTVLLTTSSPMPPPPSTIDMATSKAPTPAVLLRRFLEHVGRHTFPVGGSLDASVFRYGPYARNGSSVALLGSLSGVDGLADTLSPKALLKTVARKSLVRHRLSSLYAYTPSSSSGSSGIGDHPTRLCQNTDVVPGCTESRGAVYSTTLLTTQPPPRRTLVTAFPDAGLGIAVAANGVLFRNACSPRRSSDRASGAYQYFNNWHALVNGIPATYTYSIYYVVADASTAVNHGHGDLNVTYSRGYKGTSFAVDEFCFAASSNTWVGTSPAGGSLDASFFHYAPYAPHRQQCCPPWVTERRRWPRGHAQPQGPVEDRCSQELTLTPLANTLYAGPDADASVSVDVVWDGKTVGTIKVEYQDWTFYKTTIIATGNDKVALHGGSVPAWVFIDDIYVFGL